ncbi:YIP1 family protein [Candidatus Pacearchaeota archaeon]|nr:YIP1 family protein [Candidatus Pacearchaeota archaeon]
MPSLKEYVEKAKKKSLTRKDLAQKLLQKGYTQSEIEEAFSDGKQIHENESLPLGEKIKGLFQPATFFQSFREKTISKSFIMYAVSLFIFNVVALLTVYAGSLFFFSRPLPLGDSFFYTTIGAFLIGIIGLGIYSGITHLVIILTKHEGNFKDTHNVVAYSLVPAIIISIIPYVGWISIIYSIILMTYGLSYYHNISKGKALLAVLSPLILLVVLLGFLVIFFFSRFRFF